MPCLKTPAVPLPPLPAPFSIPSLGIGIPGIANPFCCTLPKYPLPDPQIKLPPIPPPVMALVQQGIQVVSKYLQSRTFKCPRE